ncbi:DUF6340 family protein [Flavobacteriaceae bacterium D16]|nr:DUF6340 family protein [Flavobacteriaceae bacterium D16]
MKKQSTYILISLLLLLFSISCSSTKELAIGIVEPAPVQLPNTVKRIGVVRNISYSQKENSPAKNIDALVSRDDEFLTEKGIDAAVDGLLKKLLQDPRFDTIINLSEVGDLIRTEGGQPTPNSWQDIRAFCERHELDAVFSLDYYQTDTQITIKKAKIYERDLMRTDVAKKGHELTLETLIENGWKIYDPFQNLVLDEFTFEDQISSSATGSSPLKAYLNMGTIQDSLVIKSRGTGIAYGSRLQPLEKTIFRPYYAKGTAGFIAAQDKIAEEDWHGAIALWKKELSVNKNKLQAMACHNLAVVYEYLEDLKEAKLWASKAYEYNKSKKALNYIEELELRISQNQLLQDQLAYLER